MQNETICKETSRTVAVERIRQILLNVEDAGKFKFAFSGWMKPPNASQPYSTEKHRGKQICLMLLQYYKTNNCYPQFSRSFRKDIHAADGYKHFLVTAQRKMREKILKFTHKVNRAEIERTFLNDIECLPGWHFPNLNFQPYIPGNDIMNIACASEKMH